MPKPSSVDFRALKERHQRPALPHGQRSQRGASRQLFPIPTAEEAEESARYVLASLRQSVIGKTADQQRQFVFGALRTISPFSFEQIIINCFAEMGFQTEAPQFKHDGGIDGAIYYEGAKILLQTKRYGSGESRYLSKC
ncbi:MAG: restriction endonuclease [Cyanobacteria bacterium P01_F01_bin.53]